MGKLRARDHLEDLGSNGKITCKQITSKYDPGAVWINLAQDKDK